MMLAAKDRTFVLLLQYTMPERPRARLNFITAYVDFPHDFHIEWEIMGNRLSIHLWCRVAVSAIFRQK